MSVEALASTKVLVHPGDMLDHVLCGESKGKKRQGALHGAGEVESDPFI